MDPVQEIKEKLNIVEVIQDYIPLQKAGKHYKALCPFHKEKTPSFVVSPERQTWRCFGSCNEGGDVISFVMKYENVEFYEALLSLAQKAGVDIQKISPSNQRQFGVLYDIHEEAVSFFKSHLLKNSEAQAYLSSRSLSKEIIESFNIGYAPSQSDGLFVHLVQKGFDTKDIERSGLVIKTERKTYLDRFRNRIMFPLSNTLGKTVGFSGRILPSHEHEKVGKYVNSPQTPIFHKSKIIFGIDQGKKIIKEERKVLLLEGQMDVLLSHQEGIVWAVATSGTALSDDQLQILRSFSDDIILSFDNDEAGKDAIEKAIDTAHAHDFSVYVFLPPEGKDVAEYIQNNPGNFKKILSKNTQSAFEYLFSQYEETISEKKTLRLFLQKANAIASPVVRGQWIQKLSQKIRIPEHILFEEGELIKKSKKKEKNTAEKTEKGIEETLLQTKREKIAFRMTLLAMAYPELKETFKDASIDMPERLLPLFEIAVLKKEFPQEYKNHKDRIDQIISYMEMKTSLAYTHASEEEAASEMSFLAKQLHKTFLLEQKDVLRKKIRAVEERGGDQKEIQQLLKSFDEITKVIDNDR